MPHRLPHIQAIGQTIRRAPASGCLLTLVLAFAAPQVVEAQADDRRNPLAATYVRVVASHFGLPPAEGDLLAEEGIRLEELPAALLIARESGLSPSVILSRRQRGTTPVPWIAVARQVNLGAALFWVEVAEGDRDDRARAALSGFDARDRGAWDGLELTDDQIVTLTNVRVLSRELGVPKGETLAARERSGSWVGSLQFLLGVP